MKIDDIEKEFLSEVDTKIQNKPKARKKGINSKQKGSNNERECAKILNEHFGGDYFMRSAGSGAYVGAGNRGRAEGMNLAVQEAFTGDIVPKNPDTGFYFTIEHKAYKDEGQFWQFFNESSDLHKFMEQASNDAKSLGKLPLLIIKYNNHKRICYTPKKAAIPHILEHNGWYCYWLEELLTMPNDWFFENI